MVLVKSNDGLNEGSSNNNGRCTAEIKCVGVNNSSAVREENNMQVVKKVARALSLCDLYDIMPLRKD